MSELFGPILGAAPISAVTGDRAWLRAICRVEQALAAACAQAGLFDASTAELIAAGCAEVGDLDPAGIGLAAVADGNPVIPVLARLRTSIAAQPATGAAQAARSVHLGATSQDVLDTAAMLISAAAIEATLAELTVAVAATARLAASHRDTAMIGRTLMQQAAPTTFGALALSWTAGLDRAVQRLQNLRQDGLAVQFGGAVGTLADLHPDGLRVRALLAADLGLADPGLAWHAERSRIVELGAGLAQAAAAAGTVATDIVLLAQTELGELAERSGGGSSAMPHKHNPIAAISARAASLQAPGLLATLCTAASGQELQRAAGGWHAEWLALIRLFEAAGGAAGRLASSVTGLVVGTDRMRANLAAFRTAVGEPAGFGHAGEQIDNYLKGRHE
ncbi:MAG: lyase family protein [Jatrophihabitantaceae bacterium]